jgi:preprotein translocase SecE subunit
MASQAQRRARREARRGEDVAAAPPPAPPVRPTARGGGDGQPEPHAHGRKRRFNFVRESWEELQKVEWPTQNQVIQGTVVVLIACLVVGSYLYLNDTVWKHVVSKVLLGQ